MTTIYVVILTYIRRLEEIDAQLSAHGAWLRQGYDDGVFLASGRRVPRTGGIILARDESLNSLQSRIEQDPLHQAGLTRIQIFPFQPNLNAEAFAPLLA